MITRRITYPIIMCLAFMLPASAHSGFRTTELERLAGVLSLDAQTIPDGYSHPVAKGIRLTVHSNAGVIDHIGRQLFSDEIRQQVRMAVLDFLERYFLQLKYPPQEKTAAAMVRDDEFFFVTGSLATVESLRPTDGFTFNYDRHHYEAKWNRDGRTILSVFFPVEYELISGENKIEAENNLAADVRRTQVTDTDEDIRTVVDNATYLNNAFSNRLYKIDGSLVVSSRHPAESAANMMLSMQAARDCEINITQVAYGFKKTEFRVPLRQWMAFCRNNRCELYFGVNDISNDGDVRAVVIAVNEAENYNHVLSVQIPARVIEQRSGTVEARLYSYVPMHNVSDMFAAYRKSNPKTIQSK